MFDLTYHPTIYPPIDRSRRDLSIPGLKSQIRCHLSDEFLAFHLPPALQPPPALLPGPINPQFPETQLFPQRLPDRFEKSCVWPGVRH